MHICIVTTEYSPGHGGGVGTYTSIIALLLSQAGHKVSVVLKEHNASLLSQVKSEHGIQVYKVKIRLNEYKCRSQDERLFFTEMYGIRHVIGVFARQVCSVIEQIHSECPIDVILSQDVEAPTYFLQNQRMLFNRLSDITHVVFVHSPHKKVQYYNHDPIYQRNDYHSVLFQTQSIALADGVCVASHGMRNELMAEFGLNASQISVIPLPLGELPTFCAPPATVPNERKQFVYAGRLEMRKGVELLIRAFARVALDTPDIELTLYGADCFHKARGVSMQAYLTPLIPSEVRSRIHFHGPVARANLWEHYRKAQYGIISSPWEPFSYVCQEMMASGLVVLASNTGGMADIIEHERSGFLYETDNLDMLEATIRRAAALPETAIANVSRSARDRILSYCDNQTIIDRTLAFFKQTIQRRRTDYQRHRRYLVPSNLPFGDQKLSEPHPRYQPRTTAITQLAVIVTCYNLGTYLHECVHSILGQLGVSPRIIVVDDGSDQPETLEALARWHEHPRVTVHRFENGGLPVARNRGAEIALAEGAEAIVFIDADDYLAEDYLSKALDVLNRHPEAGAVTAWTHTVGLMHTYWCPSHAQFPLLLVECMSTPPALIRARAYQQVGGICTAAKYAYEDWEFWVALCGQGYAMLCIPEPLIYYRMRRNSMSNRYNPVTLEHGLRTIYERHPGLVRRYAHDCLLFTCTALNEATFARRKAFASLKRIGRRLGLAFLRRCYISLLHRIRGRL